MRSGIALPLASLLAVACTLPGAVVRSADRRPVELIPNGSFESNDLAGWDAREGSRMELDDGALRIHRGPNESKVQWHLGQGLTEDILVWRGRIRVSGAGSKAEVWLYTGSEDYRQYHWLVQTEIAPGPEWQGFALVIPIPATKAHHAIIGARRVGGGLEIDDWSASIRER